MKYLKSFAAVLLSVTLANSAAGTPAPEQVTFVRITPEQYANSIHDIFGDSIIVDGSAIDAGFRDEGLLQVGERKLAMSSTELEKYEALAQQVAAQIVDPKNSVTLIRCQPKATGAPDPACVAQFITRVGNVLFRRPIRDDERQRLLATATAAARQLNSADAGVAAALVEMLVNPDFLFRIERSRPDAADPTRMHLDAYSVASRLSFFVWNSTPDPALLEAARSGQLLTTRGLAAQVDRLLNSPRAEAGVRAFFSDMFGFDEFATLSKDTVVYPKWTPRDYDASEQTLRTIVNQLLARNGDYRELFTTRDTFLTPSLAALYGVPLPYSGEMGAVTPWVAFTFPTSDKHVGILTQASFVALHSHPGKTSPTLRGKALREIFLCQKVPPPPANVDFTLVNDVGNPLYPTVRQRLNAHKANPVCAGCHKITDPMGLAFENFDSAAAYRTTENNAQIDVSGTYNGQKFDDVVQLAGLIKNDPATTGCFVTRVFSYGTARVPTREETAWLESVKADLLKTGVRWRSVIKTIAVNPEFYTVTVAAPDAQARGVTTAALAK